MFDQKYRQLEGIHRIQRVSVTEKSGRRHSSTVKLVCIDSGNKKKAKLNKNDVRIDTFRASGPGGQHRNKTDSGVRITHLPTGIVVTAVEDRSQHANREKAWERLREKLQSAEETKYKNTVNSQRTNIDENTAFVWTDWRDEVKKTSNGTKTSMKKALAGKLGKLLK